MEIEILEADLMDPAHTEGLLGVLDSYATDPIGGGEPLGADVRERLVPALRGHPTSLVLLALSGREAVGVAVCFRGLSTFQARPLLNIHDLAVVPDFRDKGIGRALLAEAERRARLLGCCKLTLEVQEDNARAVALYRDFGFADFQMGDSAPTRFLHKEI